MADLTAPHGGILIDLLVDDERAAELQVEARDLVSRDLNDRQLHDLELLMSGAFSPLTGFITRTDYEPVVSDMRLGAGA